MIERHIICGNSLDVLAGMDAESVDAIVTDPPYGLSFMGKRWDYDVPAVELWRECLRVLKPGGHLLSFAGTRTQHRMAVNIEDAGFEIRDMIAWVYGSGFPKSLDVSKAIDKAAGAEREIVGRNQNARETLGNIQICKKNGSGNITAPTTDAARQWQGWGTALKPALEPITVARKPFTGTVAGNVQEYGTGGLNIDGCRIMYDGDYRSPTRADGGVLSGGIYGAGDRKIFDNALAERKGRWPANLIHDGSDEVLELMPDAARFFYCAKASKAERDAGCETLPLGEPPASGRSKPAEGRQSPLGNPRSNFHPTVKPVALMRYLVRLVTPPGGLVLDPFCGSGSTGIACVHEGFRFVGIDMQEEYCNIAQARIGATPVPLL